MSKNNIKKAESSRNHSRAASTYVNPVNEVYNELNFNADNNNLGDYTDKDLITNRTQQHGLIHNQLNNDLIFNTQGSTNEDLLLLNKEPSGKRLENMKGKNNTIPEGDEEYYKTLYSKNVDVDWNNRNINSDNITDYKVYNNFTENNLELFNDKELKDAKTETKKRFNVDKGKSSFKKKSKKRLDIFSDDGMSSKNNFFDRNNIDKPKSADFIIELRKKLNASEDQYETEYLYSKVKVDEVICSVLILCSLASSVVYRGICYNDKEKCNNDNTDLLFCLSISSISNFLYSKFNNTYLYLSIY